MFLHQLSGRRLILGPVLGVYVVRSLFSFWESEATLTQPPRFGGGWRILELGNDLSVSDGDQPKLQGHLTWHGPDLQTWEQCWQKSLWVTICCFYFPLSLILQSRTPSHIFLSWSQLCCEELGKTVPNFKRAQKKKQCPRFVESEKTLGPASEENRDGV